MSRETMEGCLRVQMKCCQNQNQSENNPHCREECKHCQKSCIISASPLVMFHESSSNSAKKKKRYLITKKGTKKKNKFVHKITLMLFDYLTLHRHQFLPVEPKPPSPLSVLSKSSFVMTLMSALMISSNTNWAILSPFLISKSFFAWLKRTTLTSPL